MRGGHSINVRMHKLQADARRWPGGSDTTYPAVGYQSLSVCIHITVTSHANTLGTSAACCKGPVADGGETSCAGKKGGSCTLTVSQKICVAVPAKFSATALPGDTYVDWLDASGEDI